jgi:hypothetical protein
MRPPLIQRPRRSIPHRTRERGVTMALVALAMVAIIAMAGLSIDIGTLYQASAEAQRAADAGALAAARIISMQGLTGDPTNGATSGTWKDVCGGASSPASLAAIAVIGQNPISGASSSPSVTVSYSYPGGGPSTDCSGAGSVAFGVNPQVTVLVQQTNLPTYFSRIWGRTGNTVGATAMAEAFNPSNSGTYAGSMVPVQPRCVKPWVVPNLDPLHPPLCGGPTNLCQSFVDPGTGSITTQGVYTNGGIVGERFWLVPDCGGTTAPCTLIPGGPQANVSIATDPNGEIPPNLEYLPGQTSFSPIAVPSDGSAACTSVASSANNYAPVIAGCDQSTPYRCGLQLANTVDLSENPGIPGLSDTTSGVQCLIHQTANSTTLLSGQDALLPTGTVTGGAPPNYPFQIQVGSSNPLIGAGVASGSVITSSNNIVSLPIYDSNAVTTFGPGTTPVTVIGFLQVFVNVVDANGNIYVTVLNASGCGNAVPNGTQPLYGTSPVPVRLITPTPPSS